MGGRKPHAEKWAEIEFRVHFCAFEDHSRDLIEVIIGAQDACDVVRSSTPSLGRRFRGAGSAASPLLASSPWLTPGVRSRSAPGPAPIRRAETLVVLADGRRLLACGAFGAAGYIEYD